MRNPRPATTQYCIIYQPHNYLILPPTGLLKDNKSFPEHNNTMSLRTEVLLNQDRDTFPKPSLLQHQ